MKKQHFILLLFLIAISMLIIGCRKEVIKVVLSAETQRLSNADDKASVDTHTPCWQEGDRVFINQAAYPLRVVSATSALIEKAVPANSYRAIFPASIISATDDISATASIPVQLPSSQTYKLAGERQQVEIPMGAYITGAGKLQFHNLCSVIRLSIHNNLNTPLPLSNIALWASNAPLSGNGTAIVNGQPTDSISLPYNASHSLSLHFSDECPATVPALGTTAFYIVMPAFASNDIAITISTTNGKSCTVTQENISLPRASLRTVVVNVDQLTDATAFLVDGPTFNNAIPSNVTSVVFEYNSSVSSGTLLSTPTSPVPVYGHQDGAIWKVSTSASVINANPDCSRMFQARETNSHYLPALSEIVLGDGFNTSNVTTMAGMFRQCNKLKSIDVSRFNTENVTDMHWMFWGCSSLTSLNVSNFNTANVVYFNSMFNGCSSLKSLDLSNFNTQNALIMDWMFNDCNNLTLLDVSSFNTSNVSNMEYMFANCYSLESLDVSNFNTGKVYNMNGMFNGCRNLKFLNVSQFNTANVYDFGYMFNDCNSLTGINVSNFNTVKASHFSCMFAGCHNLKSLYLSNFNTEKVYKMSSMFQDCRSLTSLDLSNFNTEHVFYMDSMFSNCVNLTSLNLSNFDMSHLSPGGSGGEIRKAPSKDISGKKAMCLNLSLTSGHCTITCPSEVQAELQSGASLPPSSRVTFTWVTP